MIVPYQADDRLLADIGAARNRPDELHLWWLGQSGFLIQHGGRHLLFDPYLSDSLTTKYAATDKPHIRMTAQVIDPSRLDFVDVVTSSHNHTDHLDAETLRPLLAANRELCRARTNLSLHNPADNLSISAAQGITVIVGSANRSFVEERLAWGTLQKCQHSNGTLDTCPTMLDLNEGQSLSVAGFTIHAVPAAHETIERDALGRCRYLGFVVEVGGFTIYHSGDTVLFDGMVERLSRWRIDVAFLPINGRLPERRVSGNLWGREAGQLARDLGVRTVVPCHYEMFEFNSVSPDEFISACRTLQQPYSLLRAGERLSMRTADPEPD